MPHGYCEFYYKGDVEGSYLKGEFQNGMKNGKIEAKYYSKTLGIDYT